MSKICYVEKKFADSSMEIIIQANDIIEEYADEGLSLTLRQLYYQFVSRDLVPNKQSEYKRIGNIISNARLSGLINWRSIEDRTRNLKRNYHNTDPGNAVQEALDFFLLDKWLNQPYHPEVWIEKEALTGVISEICENLDVPFFACKGYTSQSEMWRASQRMKSYKDAGQIPIIIYLGDHDPSGIDMTRDIFDRHDLFMGGIEVDRIALNFDQVRKYKPPPNPAKLTDSRADGYIKKFGKSSWELDALEPKAIRNLIKKTVDKIIDNDLMNEVKEKESEYRDVLQNVVDNWREL